MPDDPPPIPPEQPASFTPDTDKAKVLVTEFMELTKQLKFPALLIVLVPSEGAVLQMAGGLSDPTAFQVTSQATLALLRREAEKHQAALTKQVVGKVPNGVRLPGLRKLPPGPGG